VRFHIPQITVLSYKMTPAFLIAADVLRNTFGFDGYVVSDEGAIEHVDVFFRYTKSPLDTAVGKI